MRRKAHNRLWTLLVLLLLFGSSTVVMPRNVWAEYSPGEAPPPGPPAPGGGDPDWPTGGATAPKPGPSQGIIGRPSPRDTISARKDRLSFWMWNVRMAFAAAFRTFFRF